MNTQEEINYKRIAQAIQYLQENFKEQPNLTEVAEKVHLSPFHFQRLFKEWAGVSPKKFLQYLSVEYAKDILTHSSSTLLAVADETGLSGTGRLHDLFITIEGMTPGDYKNGGKNLSISYHFYESPFGQILIASTSIGICFMSFVAEEDQALQQLVEKFPKASFTKESTLLHQQAISIFDSENKTISNIKLHLKGTAFQLKVWESLLKIPKGELLTYGKIASEIEKPKASRAVGTAIGNNPVAYLIPCHRVIKSTGELGQYHWGATRKAAMKGWEAAQVNAS